MSKEIIEDYRIISVKQLVRAIEEGNQNAERFCFIIGSGASASSGIPTGGTLEEKWMKEMEKNPGLDEITELAKKLYHNENLDYNFNEIKHEWQKINIMKETEKIPLSSEYYFDIYKLRFHPNPNNGYYYLEKIMENKNPSFGYRILALMLTSNYKNNLIITTNFDNLIEDALFWYTDKKAIVINHELLANFVENPNITRPIIAKLHRGIFFNPLNQPEEINGLKGKWHDILKSFFQIYTPIVIGYGGGDRSLMQLLEEESIEMRNGIYWCYVEKYGFPNEKIQSIVKQKNGYFVRTAGFDAVMLAIGNKFFPDEIGIDKTEQHLKRLINEQMDQYTSQYKELIKQSNAIKSATENSNQSEKDFNQEIEKIKVEAEKRQKSNEATAWDYFAQANQYQDLNDYDNAIKSYNKAIKLQTDVPYFYNNRGIAYGKLKKYGKALSDYNKTIELNPNYENAYNNRGIVYDKLKKYEEAIADYNKAIKLNPDYEIVYYNRGNVYVKLGRYEEALSNYNKVIELNPNNESAYYNCGIIYNKLKKYEEAMSNLNKTIELNPNLADVYCLRSIAYHELKQYKEAMSDLNKAIKLNPDLADAYCLRGIAYHELKQYKEAMSDYNKGIELNSKYKQVYLKRAEIYRLQGQIEKAIQDEEYAKKL